MIAYKKYYHCRRKPLSNGIVEYYSPIEKYGNYQPLSGYVDTLKYGENISQKWRLQVDIHDTSFSVGDLLYLDGAIPQTSNNSYENGDGANARVTSVQIGYKAIIIEIDKIIEDN